MPPRPGNREGGGSGTPQPQLKKLDVYEEAAKQTILNQLKEQSGDSGTMPGSGSNKNKYDNVIDRLFNTDNPLDDLATGDIYTKMKEMDVYKTGKSKNSPQSIAINTIQTVTALARDLRDKHVEAMNSRQAEHKGEMTLLENQNSALEKIQADLQAELKTLQQENERLTEQAKFKDESINEQQVQIEELNDKLISEREKYLLELRNMEDIIKQLQSEREQLQQDIAKQPDTSEEEVTTQRQKIEQLNAQIIELQSQVENHAEIMRISRGEHASAKELMMQFEKNQKNPTLLKKIDDFVENELEKTKQKLLKNETAANDEADSRLQEVKKQQQILKGQIAKTAAAEAAATEAAAEAAKAKAAAKTAEQAAKAKMATETNELKKLKSKLEQKEKKFESQLKTVTDQLATSQSELEALGKKFTGLEAQNKSTQAQNKRTQAENDEQKAKIEQLNENLRLKQAEIVELGSVITNLENAKSENKKLIQERDELVRKLDEQTKANNVLTEQLNEVREQYNKELVQMKANLLQNYDNQVSALNAANKSNLEEMERTYKQAEGDITKRYDDRVAKITEQKAAVDKKVEELNEENEKLNTLVQVMSIVVQNAQTNIKNLLKSNKEQEAKIQQQQENLARLELANNELTKYLLESNNTIKILKVASQWRNAAQKAKVSKMERALKDLRSNVVTQSEQIDAINTANARLQKEKVELEQQLEDIRKARTDEESKDTARLTIVREQTEQIQKLETQLEKVRENESTLQVSLDEVNKQKTDLQKVVESNAAFVKKFGGGALVALSATLTAIVAQAVIIDNFKGESTDVNEAIERALLKADAMLQKTGYPMTPEYVKAQQSKRNTVIYTILFIAVCCALMTIMLVALI